MNIIAYDVNGNKTEKEYAVTVKGKPEEPKPSPKPDTTADTTDKTIHRPLLHKIKEVQNRLQTINRLTMFHQDHTYQ